MADQNRSSMNANSGPQIIFENDHFWLIDKPAGWLSIPGRDTTTTAPPNLVKWIQETSGTPAWIVHRLDRFTSGMILFAKSAVSHREANQWFEQRKVKKVYQGLAVSLDGSPLPGKPAHQIKTPIDGKTAQTLFEVIRCYPGFFHFKATPITGRFHQIRAHAQTGHFPLLGDFAHGFPSDHPSKPFGRVALHASELTLPFGTFRSELPDDFTHYLKETES